MLKLPKILMALKRIIFLQDAVEALFSNVNVCEWYEVGIVAESAGGVSLESIVSMSIDDEVAGRHVTRLSFRSTTSISCSVMHRAITVTELPYREIIVALPLLLTIVVIFIVFYVQHRNKKNKQINMKYMCFEVILSSKRTSKIRFIM